MTKLISEKNKHKQLQKIARVLFLVATMAGFSIVNTFAQSPQFTYQGRFTDSTAVQPTNGTYEMEFKAFTAPTAGTQLGSTATLPTVQVTNGIFTVMLDFGALTFRGADVFLDISVRPSGSANPLTPLTPRQQVTSAPYAIQSLNSANAMIANDSANLGTIPANLYLLKNGDGSVLTNVNAANLGSIAANLYLLKNGDGSALTNVNAAALGGFSASSFVQTSDTRLSDARAPTAGSANYVQNSTVVQASSNFNVSGNGTAGGTLTGNIVNAGTQFNINNVRILVADANDNLFAGKNTGAALTSGFVNSSFGNNSGKSLTSGNNNSFFGNGAGQFNANGLNNSFFGQNTGVKNIGGGNNSFFGAGAGFNNLSNNNSFFGYSAGQASVSGANNAFFGSFAGFSNLASKNSFFGYSAGQLNTNGNNNSFFGESSGSNNDAGNNNSFFGNDAGKLNQGGSQNTFVGAQAGDANVTGSSTTLVGYNAGGNVSNMIGTTAVGSDSSPKGDLVTLLGYQSNSASGVTNSTAIGANATVTTSNTVVIGTMSMTTEFPGMVRVLNLGAAGSTSLCRNASNQISTCTPGNFTGTGNEQITALQQQNMQLLEQLKVQQSEIEELKMIICASNPAAKFCSK